MTGTWLSGEQGYFGEFGGAYVPESLVAPLQTLAAAYEEARRDDAFMSQLTYELMEFAGRPTPLTLARHLSAAVGRGVRVYLKREDLLHGGSCHLNHALGQVLLARRMGMKRLVAETGNGQHGVAAATAASLAGMACVVYMGAEDMRRQPLTVQRMQALGAEVTAVQGHAGTRRDAFHEAMAQWMEHAADTALVPGSAVGPHPYPTMVRDFQTVIGREAREQILDAEGRLPDRLIACVGGGANSLGLFTAFLGDDGVALDGVQAAGEGLAAGRHAASMAQGTTGVFQGARTRVLQDDHGNVLPTSSIAAGMDYPAVGPEHAMLAARGRVRYTQVEDRQAVAAFRLLATGEGVIPALESSHAIAWLLQDGAVQDGEVVVLGLSGRGDHDLDEVLRWEARQS